MRRFALLRVLSSVHNVIIFFNLSTQHGKSKEFLLKCSFLEIYHEQVFDLLEPSAMCLHLRESIKKGVYVDGLAEIVVTSASEAYGVSVYKC